MKVLIVLFSVSALAAFIGYKFFKWLGLDADEMDGFHHD